MDPVFNYFQARTVANKSQTKVTAEFPEVQITCLHVAVTASSVSHATYINVPISSVLESRMLNWE